MTKQTSNLISGYKKKIDTCAKLSRHTKKDKKGMNV